MNPLYNLGIRIYSCSAGLVGLGSDKVSAMLDGQRETFSRLEHFRKTLAPDGFDVWFHAASLGEFEQARPIIESLLENKPESKILLSFFSPSGYKVRRDFHPSVAVVYLPFDLPRNASRFIEIAQPKMAVFVKYEFWGNYLQELSRRAIPVYIISTIFRPEQIFFKPWGGEFRKMLACFDRLYVQDERSRDLLASIGITNSVVAGDTRFDRVAAVRDSAREIEAARALRDRAGDGRMLVVGSSWEPDEDVYIPWLKEHPDVCAIIAPHEFDNHRLETLRHALGEEKTVLLSELDKGAELPAGIQYIIVDCFGLLSSLYRYADVAYVGGGFGAGIHNVNEAAAYGIPVVFGPKHKKFNEAAGLIDCGAAYSIHSLDTADSVLSYLFAVKAARLKAGKAAADYIDSHVGASAVILNDLFQI